jgi:quercetin dioxygenase-like cupin family protein
MPQKFLSVYKSGNNISVTGVLDKGYKNMKKINITSILNSAPVKNSRKEIFKEGTLDIGLLQYSPGQTTPDHKHSDLDEVFYVLSGEGTLTINGEPVILKENDIIYSPRGEFHGFCNTSNDDLIVLQIKNSHTSNV